MRLAQLFRRPLVSGWLVAGVGISMALTVSISYRAVTEWQRTAAQLAERRAETSVDLLVSALNRDMSAVQLSLLSGPNPDEIALSLDSVDLVASTFARYPYPEVFFTWRNSSSSASVTFFSRTDRNPSWMPQQRASNPSPVTIGIQPSIARPLLERMQRDAALGYRYAIFNIDLESRQYQVVALLSYADPFREQLKAASGFMVDLAWVRRNYFRELTHQVEGIGRTDARVALMIVDAHGDVIVDAQPGVHGNPVGRRQFPLFFFDRRVVAANWPQDLDREAWTAQAFVSQDPTLIAANTGARRTLAIVSVTTLVLAIGIILTVHAVRRTAQLAEMQSTFVSTVTHELKAPLALLQVTSQTFATDRGITPEVTRKHGRLALHEVKRLRRLIDNLLAYARITDVTEVYTFEPLDTGELVDLTLRDFASQLEYGGFDVRVDVPADLPPVRADRSAMSLAFGNLIDNAIRYSRERRQLDIEASCNGKDFVVLHVSDKGVGISDDEIPNLTRRFFRGRRADLGGTGLGLAIVDRIVTDHGGTLAFKSTVGEGTTVTVELPLAKDSN